MSTINFRPPTYSPRLQAHLEKLRKQYESLDRPTVSQYVAPRPGAGAEEEEPGRMERILSGLGALQQNISRNVRDLPIALATGGPVAKQAQDWMHRSPDSWYRRGDVGIPEDPSIPPPIPAPELAKDTYVGRVEPTDSPVMQHAKAAARGVTGRVVDIASDPVNAALVLATHGASAVVPAIGTAANLGFGAMMLKGAWDSAERAYSAYREEGWSPAVSEAAAEAAVETGLVLAPLAERGVAIRSRARLVRELDALGVPPESTRAMATAELRKLRDQMKGQEAKKDLPEEPPEEPPPSPEPPPTEPPPPGTLPFEPRPAGPAPEAPGTVTPFERPRAAYEPPAASALSELQVAEQFRRVRFELEQLGRASGPEADARRMDLNNQAETLMIGARNARFRDPLAELESADLSALPEAVRIRAENDAATLRDFRSEWQPGTDPPLRVRVNDRVIDLGDAAAAERGLMAVADRIQRPQAPKQGPVGALGQDAVAETLRRLDGDIQAATDPAELASLTKLREAVADAQREMAKGPVEPAGADDPAGQAASDAALVDLRGRLAQAAEGFRHSEPGRARVDFLLASIDAQLRQPGRLHGPPAPPAEPPPPTEGPYALPEPGAEPVKPPAAPPPTEVPPVVEGAAVPAPEVTAAPPAEPAPPTERPPAPTAEPAVPPGEPTPGPAVPPTPGAPEQPDYEQAGPAVRGDIGRGPGGEGWVVRFYDRQGREAMPPMNAPTKKRAKEILKDARTTLARNRREERKVTLSPEEAQVVTVDPITLRDTDSFQMALEAYAQGDPRNSSILRSLRSAKQLGAEINPAWYDLFPLLKEVETTGKRSPLRPGELNPQMSPEERAEYITGERVEGAEAADLFYVSGMSRPADIAAAAQLERPFGVDVGELSTRGVDEVAAAVGRRGANVFVDSGAYSLFRRNLKAPEGIEAEAMDFETILGKYDELLDRTATLADPEEHTWGTYSLVMPDVVGDQAATLEAIDAWSTPMNRFFGVPNVNPIVPLQKGEMSLFEMYERVQDLLGTDEFTVGLPGNAAAVTVEEVGEFIKQATQAGQTPSQIHFLGVGPGARLDELVDAVHQNGPMDPNKMIPVTADANRVRSLMGPGIGRLEAAEAALGAEPGTLEGGATPLETPGVRNLPESLQKMDPIQRLEYIALVEAGIAQGNDTPEKLIDWASEQLIVDMPPDEAAWHLARAEAKAPVEEEEEEPAPEVALPPPAEAPAGQPVVLDLPAPKKVKRPKPAERDAYIEEQGGDTELYKANTYKQNSSHDPVRSGLHLLRAAEANFPNETAYLDALKNELAHDFRFYAIKLHNPEYGDLDLDDERAAGSKARGELHRSLPDVIKAAWAQLERQRQAAVVDGRWVVPYEEFSKAEERFRELGFSPEGLRNGDLWLSSLLADEAARAEGLMPAHHAFNEILRKLPEMQGYERFGIDRTDEKSVRQDLMWKAVKDRIEAKTVQRAYGEGDRERHQEYVPIELVSEVLGNPPVVDEEEARIKVAEAKRLKEIEERNIAKKKGKQPKKKEAPPKPQPNTPEQQLDRLIQKYVEPTRRQQVAQNAEQYIRLAADVRRRKEDLKGKKGGRKAKREYEEQKLKLEGVAGGFETFILSLEKMTKSAAKKMIRLIERIAKEKIVVPKSQVKTTAKFLALTQRTMDSAVDHLDLDPTELEEAVERNSQEISVPEDLVLTEVEQDAQRFLGMDERGEKEDVLAYNVVTKAWDRAKKVKIRWKFHFGEIPGLGEKTLKQALRMGPEHSAFKKIVEYRTRKLVEGRAIEEALAEMKPDYFDDPEAKAALESIGIALAEDLQEVPEPAGRPALTGETEGQFADGTETHLLKTFMWGLKKPGTQESFTTQEVVDAIQQGQGQAYVRIVHAFRDAVAAEGGEVDDVPFDIPEGGLLEGEGPVESTPAKPYGEQKYAWAVPVKITWPDGMVHHDAVKGLNPGHALYLARENWPGARVEVDDQALYGVEAPRQPYGKLKDKTGQSLIPGFAEATMETPIITEGNLPGKMFTAEEEARRARNEKGEKEAPVPGQIDLFGGPVEASRPFGGRYGPRAVRPTKKQLELFERPAAKPVDRPVAPSYSPSRGEPVQGRGGVQRQPAPGGGPRPEGAREPAAGRPPSPDRRGGGPAGVEHHPQVPAAPGAAPRAGIFDILTIRPEATAALAPDFDLVPSDLKGHLNQEQHVGVSKAIAALDKGQGFLLADGTGVGKTRQVLAVAARYARQGKKVLILAPAEVMKAKKRRGEWTISGSYVDDGAQMGIGVKFLPSDTRGKPQGELQPGTIHISTYYKVALQPIDADTILIADEAHKFKSAYGSQTGMAGVAHAKTANAVLFATATPGDKPIHLLYLDRIGIREGKTEAQFMKDLGMRATQQEFRLKDPTTGEWKTHKKTVYTHGASKKKTYELMEALFERLTRTGNIIRREIDMAGMDIQFREVPLGDETKEMLDRIAEARWANRAVMLQHQRRQQEPDKLPAAQDVIQKELAEGRSVVVFASRVNFSEATVKTKIKDRYGEEVRIEKEVIASSEGTLKLLRKWLQDQGISYAEVHGAAEKGAAEEMARFQNGEAQVMIATPEAGGTGINLDDRSGNRPRTMVVITAPFDSINNVQMVGRIHRVTTKSQGRVIYLFSDQTVDDWNKSIIGTKMKMLGAQVSGNVGLLDPGEMSEFGDPSQPDPGGNRKREAPAGHIARTHLETLIRNRGQDVVSLKQFRFIRRRLQALGAVFDERHETLGKYGDFTIVVADGEPFKGRLMPPEGDIGPSGYVSYAGPGEELPTRSAPDPKVKDADPEELDDVVFEMNQLASGANKYRGRRQAKPLVSVKQNRFIYNRLKKLGAVFAAPVGDPHNSFQIKTTTTTIFGKFDPYRPAAGNTNEIRGVFAWEIGERPSFYAGSPKQKYGTDAAIGLDELISTLDEFKDWRDFHIRHAKTLASLFGADAQLFRALLGITSQAADVRANVALAVKAYQQMRLGEPFKGYLPAVRRNLERFRSSDSVRGQKIRPYTRAELGIDDIAVDRHIARFVLGRENLANGNSPNAGQVKFIQNLLRQAADELGWTGDEAASAAWAAQQIQGDKIPPEEVMTYDEVLQRHATAIRRFRAYFGDVAGPGGRVDAALSTLAESGRDPVQIALDFSLGGDRPNTHESWDDDAIALDWVERVIGPPGQFQPYRIGTGTALEDLVSGPAEPKHLGGSIREAFFRDGEFGLDGMKVSSIYDLGLLGQLLRNPAFETSYIFPIKDGKILESWAETVRLPTSAPGTPRVEDWTAWKERLIAKLDAIDAEGFYAFHNHPSGDPQASVADINLAGVLYHLFGDRFRGQVIVDHGTFTAMDPRGPQAASFKQLAQFMGLRHAYAEGDITDEQTLSLAMGLTDAQRLKQRAHEWIEYAPSLQTLPDPFFVKNAGDLYRRRLGSGGELEKAVPEVLALRAAETQGSMDPLAVFVDVAFRVRQVASVPKSFFTDDHLMQGWVLERARAIGADNVMLVIAGDDSSVLRSAQLMIRKGFALDGVVVGGGLSTMRESMFVNRQGLPFRENIPYLERAQISPGIFVAEERGPYRGRRPRIPAGGGGGDDGEPPDGPFNWPDNRGPGTRWWDRRVAYARARMKARWGEAAMGLDPRWFWDAVVLGADRFARGFRSFARWALSMSEVKDRGLLSRVWDYLQKIAKPQYQETIRRGKPTDLDTIQPGRPTTVRPIPEASKGDVQRMLKWLESMMVPDPGTGKPPEFNWKGDRIGLSTNITRIADENGIRAFITQAAHALESKFGEARSYRSWQEAKEMALELGWTESDFRRALKEKGALTDYEIVAGRILRQEASLDFINKQQAWRDAKADLAQATTPQERAARQQTALELEREMHAALQKAVGIQYATVAAGSEAGRALAAHRMWIESLTPEERFLQRMMRGRKPGDELIDELAKAVQARDMKAVDRIYRKIHKPTRLDQFLEYWINSILSGPATQGANVTGNLVHEVLLRTPERGIAAQLEQRGVRQALERFFTGEARPQERVPGEAMEATRALVKYRFGLMSALKLAKRALLNEDIGFGVKGEYRPPAIPGKFGKIVRTPGRIMEALDIGAKYAAASSERAAQVFRKAMLESRGQGWTEEQLRTRMEEINQNLDKYMEIDTRRKLDPREVTKEEVSFLLRNKDLGKIQKEMERQADISTFRDETTLFSKYVQLLRARYPWLTFIVPFIRTPERILVQAVRRTPVGLARTIQNIRSGKLSGGEASDRLAQGILGSAISAGVYMLAKDGLITGGGPADWDERRNWLATGKQPYAIKIGDTWVSLARIEPLATTLGFAADLAEASDEKIAGDIWDKLHYSIMNNITGKTYLEGMVSAAEAVGDPDRYGARFFKRMVGAMVPNLFASAARAIDPTIRQTDDISSTLLARTPWFSQTLPPKLTGLGEPVQRGEDPFSRFASPFRYSPEAGPEKNLERLFLETGYAPNAPPRSMSIPGTMGRKVQLTQMERQMYAAYAARATTFARSLTANADWEHLDIYAKTEFLKRIYRFAHDAARRQIMRSVMARVATGEYELKEMR